MRGSIVCFALAALASLGQAVSIADATEHERCVYAGLYSLSSLTFKSSASSSVNASFNTHSKRAKTVSTSMCTNVYEVSSIYATSLKYCSESDLQAGLSWWKEYCSGLKSTLKDLDPIMTNVTTASLGTYKIVDPSKAGKSNISEIVISGKSYFELALKTISVDEDYKNQTSAYALIWFWVGLLAIGVIQNFVTTLFHRTSTLKALNRSPIACWFRTHVSTPASISDYHSRHLFWCTIPTRLVSLIVFGFWIFSVIMCATRIPAFHGNLAFTGKSFAQQAWGYLVTRCGYLALATFPLMWMFAGRNNIFIWATGWSFQTFNIFHRHIARIGTLFAIIHSIGYTWLSIVQSKWDSRYVQEYFKYGIVAACCMGCLLLFSFSPFRKRCYDAFLILHIGLAILTLYAAYIHVTKFDTEYHGYIWPPVAIWSFDRFLRVVRLIWCNINARKLDMTRAVASYNPESDVIRVDIQPSHSLLKAGLGQYYYLYQPLDWRGYENHPFTLGAYTSEPEGEKTGRAESDAFRSKLTFWIRPLDGWTKRLRAQCMKSSTLSIQPRLLIEGPYGHAAHLDSYDSVLFIVGGTGVSAAIPYILDHVKRPASSKSTTSSLHLCWTARQSSFIKDVCSTDLALALEHPDVNVSLFATGNAQSDDGSASDNGSSNEKCVRVKTQSRDLTIQHGRLNIFETIESAAREADRSSSSLVVLACGPAAMADETRASVHSMMKRGHRQIHYIEETYGW